MKNRINQTEVNLLLKQGGFLDMSLADLQREHAELISFNTSLDRERNVYRDQAKEHMQRNAAAKSLIDGHFHFNKDNPEMTLMAIQRALIGTGD